MPRVGCLCICMLLLKLNFYNCILGNTTLKVKPSPNLDSMVALRLLSQLLAIFHIKTNVHYH